MNPLIACGFIGASISLLLLLWSRGGKTGIKISGALALIILALGAFKLCVVGFHWQIDVDNWLSPGKLAAASDPSIYFAPKSAFALLLIGGGLLLLRRPRTYRYAEIVSLCLIAIGALSLQGYAFGLLELYAAPNFVPPSVASGLGIALMGTAMLFAQTEHGAMNLLASSTAGGLLARRLMPIAVLLPFLLGKLRLWGETAGWYDAKFGVALFSTAFIFLFLGVVWWTARLLHRLDLLRRAAESAIQKSEGLVRGLNLELEQRITERTSALDAANASNEELDAFSYSVSHDLRAPLRAIGGFSRIVIEEHGAALNADGLRYLHLVERSAQQMGQLIDDLLMFSRTGRQALALRTVRTTEMVNTCLTDLQSMQEHRNVEINVGELPDCQADASLLRQVWLNLLANALKYTRKCDSAVVTIGCHREGETDNFFVRDNGAGFDVKYADKLFGVFQRLHLADDYEGTGVGLALVQRIVQRHGGRVWAEAKPNLGATFHFNLTGGWHA